MAETPDQRSDRWKAVHERALKRFDAIWTSQQMERRECLDDRRFSSIRGAQWDEQWGIQFENAPRLEINKTHKEIVRIFSDYRSNRITVDFRPDDDATDDETAETLNGLYRADEHESDAQECYDTAFDEGVSGGMGAARIRAKYEDEGDPDNDHQRVVFEPITDADQRVFFDLDAKRQDKKDARFGFVLTGMSADVFNEDYPGHEPADFRKLPVTNFEWFKPQVYTVGEYYERDEEKTRKVTLTHPVIEGDKVLLDPTTEMLNELESQGWKIERTRIVKRPKITKYVMTGQEVLSEERIPGGNIPIVPFYAKRWVVEGIERCAGHTRYAKDPQRAYNAEVSQLAEIAAMSPFEKPIFDPEQVAGLESRWAESNIKRLPFEVARALRNEDGSIASVGPIGKVTPPTLPQALASLIELSGKDVDDLLGADDQPEAVPANTSAEAIQLANTRADSKTFIYLDNFSKFMRRMGEVWLGFASELYIEEDRQMDTLDDQGGRSTVKLAQPGITKDGSMTLLNDFSNGKFKVFVDVGPSTQSRRDANVKNLLGAAELVEDPQLKNVLVQSALTNMDGEGLDDVQKWIRMQLIQQGVVQPTDDEKQQLAELAQKAAQQPPSATDQLANAELAVAQATALDKKADAILKTAQAQAVGGPDAVPDTPNGLKHIKDLADINKTAAEADQIRTETAHMPQKLAIEATNARSNQIKALHSAPKPAQSI
jgi:hypothetical protein